jgi:phosphate transport system permease protein
MATIPANPPDNLIPITRKTLRRKARLGENTIEVLLFISASASILTTIGIVYELFKESLLFFSEVPLTEFLLGTKWQPQIDAFGVLPLVTATLMTTFIGMLIALPLGLFVAIYLSEFASPKARSIIKPVLEVLAGIPTVVYGFFALTFITPFLRSLFGKDVVEIYNMASAGIAMGILILPTIATHDRRCAERRAALLREAAYGLRRDPPGNRHQNRPPAAISGIAAAFIVGISRAIGETMIVAIAAGAGPNFTFNPFNAAETMTGHIVRISGGDLSYDSIDYNSIFAIALLLFFITLTLNIISQRIVRHFREEYE